MRSRDVEMTRPQRGHRFTQHLLDAPMTVKTDGGRLEHVFVNLLTNAAKYTPEGGTIEIRATLERDEALVYFTDTGVGIPREMQPHDLRIIHPGRRQLRAR